MYFFFFFQAEDGIRDLTVTGVQTCALPISEPAVGHEVHAGATALFLDDFLRLALRTDEQHAAATGSGVAHEVVRALEQASRLVEVDDVNADEGAVDVLAHLRVPALGLMTEVHAGFEELADSQGVRGITQFACDLARAFERFVGRIDARY